MSGNSTLDIVGLAAITAVTAGAAAPATAPAAAGSAAASGFVPAASAGGFQLATGAGAAAGGGLFTAGNVALGTSLLAGAGSVFSGIQQNAAAKAQASNARLQAQAQQTQSAQRNLQRRKQLSRSLASQRAAASVSGFQGLGTARSIANEDRSRAASNIADERLVSGINSQNSLISARSRSSAGTSSLISSGLQGLGTAGQGVFQRQRIG